MKAGNMYREKINEHKMLSGILPIWEGVAIVK
jgi:hypothetical protein